MESALPDKDNRSEGRANVFLGASLEAAGKTIAVRIRNISSSGALVEASSLPEIGTAVRLRRGELNAPGKLAWIGAGQAGVNFSGKIDVESWVKRSGTSGQQRVDQVIAALRNSSDVPAHLHDASPPQSLAAISAELDHICERLVNNSNVSMELGEDLLRLDSVAQALRQLASGRAF